MYIRVLHADARGRRVGRDEEHTCSFPLHLGSILLVSRAEVMINRDSWGHSYLTVRGEILGFVKDGLLRKHLPRMFSLIKNES